MVERLTVPGIAGRRLDSWAADWAGLDAVVLGLDAASFGVVDTLAELGAAVRVVASEPDEQYAGLLPVIGASLTDATAVVGAGHADLVVVTAETASEDPVVSWARRTGVPVLSDLELAWRVRDKTTAAEWLSVASADSGDGTAALTVDLAVHLIASAGIRVAGVGRGNVPVLDAVRDPEGFAVLVVESGERELGWLEQPMLAPLASVCLPGPGDATLLARVYAGTRVACLYDKSDDTVLGMVEDAEVVEGCRAIGYDLGTPGPSDLGMVDDIVVDRAFHESRHREALELTTHGELAANGLGDPASVRAVLAASALARAVGVAPEIIAAALASFRDTRPA